MTPQDGVGFEVTLSVAGSVVVSISRHGHTIGTTTLHLPAGATTFTITKAGGHPLTTGSDVAKVRVTARRGSATRLVHRARDAGEARSVVRRRSGRGSAG